MSSLGILCNLGFCSAVFIKTTRSSKRHFWRTHHSLFAVLFIIIYTFFLSNEKNTQCAALFCLPEFNSIPNIKTRLTFMQFKNCLPFPNSISTVTSPFLGTWLVLSTSSRSLVRFSLTVLLKLSAKTPLELPASLLTNHLV